MENETCGVADSFIARHTTDLALRSELLANRSGSTLNNQATEMRAEVKMIEYSVA